ncbi:MAG: glycosyltransferase, partial [Desulfurococcaceae archaeon]
KICLYGTVYNNAGTVEECIKSVWRPEYEIVVVDNYSTDGTWEKLLELRREFNLKIYRYRCSRGLGRHIALYKCSPGSTTAWFDLDTVYNESFHKVIEYAAETNLRIHAGVLAAKRELILSKGGWRDLNYGEDVELVSRVGFDIHVPVVVGINAELPAHIYVRERRYGGLRRVARASIDLLRGNALSIRRLLVNKSKRAALFYLPARVLGFYKNRKPDNATWIDLAVLAKAIPPKKAGIDERYFHMRATLTLLSLVKGGESAVDARVLSLVSGRVYKLYLRTREFRVLYYKDLRYFEKSYMPLVEGVGVLN